MPTLSQMGHVLAIRAERESCIQRGPLSIHWLLGSLLLTIVLQMATVHMPFLNLTFTMTLTLDHLALWLLFSPVVVFAVELEK